MQFSKFVKSVSYSVRSLPDAMEEEPLLATRESINLFAGDIIIDINVELMSH